MCALPAACFARFGRLERGQKLACQQSVKFAIFWHDDVCRASAAPAKIAQIRHSRNLARLVQSIGQFTQDWKDKTMKTFSMLFAALLLSATMVSATVSVPVDAAAISA